MAKSLKRVISVSLALLLMVTVFACAFVVPSSAASGGNMFELNCDTNNVKINFISDKPLLVPGEAYTYKVRYISDYGYSADNLKGMFAMWAASADDSTTSFWRRFEGFTESYDGETATYIAKFVATAGSTDTPIVEGTNNYVELAFGDRNGGGTVKDCMVNIADIALIRDATGENVLADYPIDADHSITSEAGSMVENPGKWRVYPADKVSIKEKGDTFPEIVEPEPEPGKMFELNCDQNNVKIEYLSDSSAQLIPGASYTLTAKYVSDYGYGADALKNMFALWSCDVSGSNTSFFRRMEGFTERYDGETHTYIAEFKATAGGGDPEIVAGSNTYFKMRFADRNGDGTVRDCMVNIADVSLFCESTGENLLANSPIDEEHKVTGAIAENPGKWRVYPEAKIAIKDKGDTFGDEEAPSYGNGKMFELTCDTNNVKINFISDKPLLVPGAAYTYKVKYVSDYGYSADNLKGMFAMWAATADDSTTSFFRRFEGFTESYDGETATYTAKFIATAGPTDTAIVAGTNNYVELAFGDRNGGGTVQGCMVNIADIALIRDSTGENVLADYPIDEEHMVTSEAGSMVENPGKWRIYPADKVSIKEKGDTFGDQEEKPEPVYGNGKMFVLNCDTNNVKINFISDKPLLVPGQAYTYRVKYVSDHGYGVDQLKSMFAMWAATANDSTTSFFRRFEGFTESYDGETCTYIAKFVATAGPTDTAIVEGTNNYVELAFGDRNGGGAVKDCMVYIADIALIRDATGENVLADYPIDAEHMITSEAGSMVENPGKWRIYPTNKVRIQDKGNTFGDGEEPGESGETAKPEMCLDIENAEGIVSQFVTAKPDTDYAFSFKFKSDNGGEAEPYIEAFSSNASLGKPKTRYITKDADGYYNYYCEFTAPAGLAEANNLRVGLSVKQSDVIAATDFELFELDSRGEKGGENLINDPEFATTFSVGEYDGTPSNKWTFEGTGTVGIAEEVFVIPAPQVLLFAGGKAPASVVYDTALTPGDYTVSLNLKYGSEGYEGDTGVELKYHNGSAWVDVAATGGKVAGEFKNTYTLTLPADARTGKDNFRVSVKVGSATVTGYVSNLEIYSATGAKTNLAANGDLSAGTEKWSLNGLGYSKTAPLPDGYFKENADLQRGMFYYRNSTTWDWFSPEYLTLKSNTYYLAIIERIHPLDTDETDHRCVSAFQVSGKTSDGEYYTSYLDSVTPTKYEGARCTRHILTPEGLNATNNTKLLNVSQLAGSYGYWGGVELYESNENGDILSNNILLNGDLTLGMTAWKTSSSDGFTWRFVDEPEGFFDKYKVHEDQMITSTGSEANAQFGQVLTVERGKKYYFQGQYVNMNAAGVTPKAYYKDENGKWVDSGIPVFVDNDRYYFEMEFELPDEAYSRRGQAEVKFVIENGNKGKGYLSDLAVYEEGSYENLFKDAAFANGTKNWTTSGNYKVTPYDGGLFKFHYDDKAFNDGNWSGEAAAEVLLNGSVVGAVLKGDGNPYKGITMMLEPGGLKAVTDAEGVYRFDELKPGKYSLSLRTPGKTVMFVTDVEVKSGFLSSVSDITLSLEEEISFDFDVDVDLEPQYIEADYGIVRGYLYDVDATLLTNTKIYLGKIAETKTDSKGMFEFGEVPPGKYDLYTKDKDGNVQILKNIEVLAGKGSVYKVQLPFDEESSNLWLIIALIGAGVVVLAGGAVAAILIAKKKKGSNA